MIGRFFLVGIVCFSVIFQSCCMGNPEIISADLEMSVKRMDSEIFAETIKKFERLGVAYLTSGKTPLTIALKTIKKIWFNSEIRLVRVIRRKMSLNEKDPDDVDTLILKLDCLQDNDQDNEKHLEIAFERLKEGILHFFTALVPQLLRYINRSNQEGQLPLEIALQLSLMEFATMLIKAGAYIHVINRVLLSKKINGQFLINELIDSYIEDYWNALVSLDDKCFKLKKKGHKYTLWGLISLYCSRIYIDNSLDTYNEMVVDVIIKSEDEICEQLKVLKKKKHKRDAKLYFTSFLGGKNGDKLCLYEKKTNNPIKKVFREFEEKVCANSRKQFSCNEKLFDKQKNNKFIDTKIICIY